MDCFGFEELEIWKFSREFKKEISLLSRKFPSEEKYKLTDQIIRSVRSITALISEGHGRFSYPDQIHYCVQARGSLTETVNHLIDASDENYITESELLNLKTKAKRIERMLNGYIKFLRGKMEIKKTPANPKAPYIPKLP